MPHRTNPCRTLLALAGAALLAGACSDELVSPRAASDANASASLAAGEGRPRLIPAHVKYSDQGARPATGRSGSATLAVQALQGKDGGTELRVTAGTVATGASAALEKVQVKQINTDGALVRTVNHNHLNSASAVFAYEGLARGSTLQVQGNVDTGARTGVVTVVETVHLRPDLRPSLSAPEAALVGVPVNVVATVTEANGDVGARANCVLMVNDVQADRADGIWVDAGDAVSCAFTHIFSAPGTARLRVLVLDVVPADYDDTNNAAEATMQVSGAEPEPSDFSYYADAQDVVTSGRMLSVGTTQYPDENMVMSDSSIQDRTDTFTATMFNGWMSRSVSLPLTRVEMRQESGGVELHSATYTDVSGDEYGIGAPGCTSRWNGGGALFYLCTSGPEFPHTSFQYLLYGTTIVYSGSAHTTQWYTQTGETYYFYSEYGPEQLTDGLPLFAIGSTVSFSMKITDGAQTYQAATTVVMQEPETTQWTQFEPTGTMCDSGFYSPTQSWSRCWTHAGTTTRRFGWVGYYIE